MMKIIIDACVPRIAKLGLPKQDIRTVQEMGWAGIKNGQLLKLVSSEFDVFITSDQNLRYQQNLASLAIGVIVLPSNQVPIVKALIPKLEGILCEISVGEIVEIPMP